MSEKLISFFTNQIATFFLELFYEGTDVESTTSHPLMDSRDVERTYSITHCLIARRDPLVVCEINFMGGTTKLFKNELLKKKKILGETRQKHLVSVLGARLVLSCRK